MICESPASKQLEIDLDTICQIHHHIHHPMNAMPLQCQKVSMHHLFEATFYIITHLLSSLAGLSTNT